MENKLPEGADIKVCYLAHGTMYAVIEQGDTVRFYRLDQRPDGSHWEVSDVYIKSDISHSDGLIQR